MDLIFDPDSPSYNRKSKRELICPKVEIDNLTKQDEFCCVTDEEEEEP
jgi:hypothetical protein